MRFVGFFQLRSAHFGTNTELEKIFTRSHLTSCHHAYFNHMMLTVIHGLTASLAHISHIQLLRLYLVNQTPPIVQTLRNWEQLKHLLCDVQGSVRGLTIPDAEACMCRWWLSGSWWRLRPTHSQNQAISSLTSSTRTNVSRRDTLRSGGVSHFHSLLPWITSNTKIRFSELLSFHIDKLKYIFFKIALSL